MADNDTNVCRICLTTYKDVHISDSSCYTKFFIQVMSLKDFKEKLLLCIWCKAALKRAMSLLTMALESEKALHVKIPTDTSSKPKSLYNLNYIQNFHIDIPPLNKEFQVNKTENIVEEINEITNPLKIQDKNEITLKINKKEMKSTDLTNEESNEITHFENEIETKKRNKNELNLEELRFGVEYLNLEQQLREVELKKLKYKEFKCQCNECGMGFLTSDIFEEHKVRHSELSGLYKCAICNLHFKSQDVLSQHSLAHKRRFSCLLCGSVFTRWSHCTAHRYKCGGVVQPIACEECAKIFSNEYSLKIHMKVHKTEKKYSCGQCDRMFGSKQRLTVHMRSHSGIKPFSCANCARSFATRSNLRAHSAVHDHTAQYYCVECHTYYKTAKSLKRHFNESAKHVALKNDMYSCKECTKQFSTEKSLNYHITTRHGTEHRCTYCEKTFSNNSNLNKHIKCIHTAK